MISDQHLLDEIKFLTSKRVFDAVNNLLKLTFCNKPRCLELINHHESAPKNVVRAASLSKRFVLWMAKMVLQLGSV